MDDLNLIDQELQIPHFTEPKSLEELLKQMAVISECIEKCEKILQNLVLSGYKEDMDEYICKHIALIAQKNKLYEKYKTYQNQKIEPGDKSDTN